VSADTWSDLDRFEWGYQRGRQQVSLASSPSEKIDCELYLALEPERDFIPPFDWYRAHCLTGAIEHALPASVVDAIRSWKVETSGAG